jgi:hypothetical protein
MGKYLVTNGVNIIFIGLTEHNTDGCTVVVLLTRDNSPAIEQRIGHGCLSGFRPMLLLPPLGTTISLVITPVDRVYHVPRSFV